MLTITLYILLPTADEIIIHPAFGLVLSYILQIPLFYGVLFSIIIYRTIGLACLLVALVVGFKPVYNGIKEDLTRKKFRKKF
jgi:hypothetical protein